jgi:DNA-binding XRE family transcriptional regulator
MAFFPKTATFGQISGKSFLFHLFLRDSPDICSKIIYCHVIVFRFYGRLFFAVASKKERMNGMDYVRILRDLREDADKTQTQIAEVLGTSQTMYARYERGANELPIHHLITLSKYYGVSTDYLLGLSKERSREH